MYHIKLNKLNFNDHFLKVTSNVYLKTHVYKMGHKIPNFKTLCLCTLYALAHNPNYKYAQLAHAL